MVTIVSFSSRCDGNCSKIADFLSKKLKMGMVFSFADFKIEPCGGCRYECFADRSQCPHIGDMECRILDAVCRSEQAIFIVPNYCDYPCANFFAFNERSNCFFQGQEELLMQYLAVPKKFIVVSNSESGHFAEAFEQHTDKTPEILFLSAKKQGKRSVDGNLLPSEKVEALLELFYKKEG